MKNVTRWSTRFAAFGAASGLLAVALGAFAAHALRGHLETQMLAVFQTATQYQLVHSILLVALGLAPAEQHRGLHYARVAFAVGIVVFSGSLYLLVTTGNRKFGMITPVGGISFLVGWALLTRHFFLRF